MWHFPPRIYLHVRSLGSFALAASSRMQDCRIDRPVRHDANVRKHNRDLKQMRTLRKKRSVGDYFSTRKLFSHLFGPEWRLTGNRFLVRDCGGYRRLVRAHRFSVAQPTREVPCTDMHRRLFPRGAFGGTRFLSSNLQLNSHPLIDGCDHAGVDFIRFFGVYVRPRSGRAWDGCRHRSFSPEEGCDSSEIRIVKMLASAITLGTGGSGGREGPIAQIVRWIWFSPCKSVGVAHKGSSPPPCRWNRRRHRGDLSWRPLAGAIFAAEILYRDADIESDVIIPSAIASTVAYSVFTQSLPADKRYLPLFGNSINYNSQSPVELIPLAILAVVLVLVGILYVRAFYGMRSLFRMLPLPNVLRPALGAGLAGVAGLALYAAFSSDIRALSVLSTGYGILQDTFRDCSSVGVGLLLAVGLVKILTTSLTISSGGSAGVFGPSMVIGGCISAAVGLMLNDYWPWTVPKPEVFAIVGMAGFLWLCLRSPFDNRHGVGTHGRLRTASSLHVGFNSLFHSLSSNDALFSTSSVPT